MDCVLFAIALHVVPVDLEKAGFVQFSELFQFVRDFLLSGIMVGVRDRLSRLLALRFLRVCRHSSVTTLTALSLRRGSVRRGRSRLGALRGGGRRGVGVVRARIRLDVAAR